MTQPSTLAHLIAMCKEASAKDPGKKDRLKSVSKETIADILLNFDASNKANENVLQT